MFRTLLSVISATLCFTVLSSNLYADTPNIILILADDLGYGDVATFNPESKIKTPNLDALASSGMAFRDMHSPSSVCTPTRYGILTGRYNWRSSLKSGVLGGYGTPLIEPDRLTLASMLKKSGYHTAVIGKWHLGLDWVKNPPVSGEKQVKEDIDFTKPFGNGPTTLGFDYYFGISASLDMPPFTYLENDHVVALPTTRKKWVREGAAAEDFEAIDVLPKLTEKAVEYIETQAKTSSPFFLYFPLNAPHAPILPSEKWQGKSGINEYADFVMQVDDTVGTIVKTVERLGISKNTLIVFTSDNGCSPVANFKELLANGHDPSAGLRGHKADIFDGGHRIPFIVRWPEKIKAGSSSNQLGCLIDFMGTFADITGQKIPDTTAEDTVSLLPAFLETATGPLRSEVIHHSINGSFAIRQGDWKLCLCPDSGGWSDPKPGSDAVKTLPAVQLYNMKSDPAEVTNLQEEQNETVQKLKSRLNDEIIPKTKRTSNVKSESKADDKSQRQSEKKKEVVKKPNILFLFADDFHAKAIGALGNPTVKTPALDKLHHEGTVFTNAHIQGSWVGAVCIASRSMLNTGLSIWRAKRTVQSNSRKDDPPLLWSRQMKAAGYTTYFTGKWHVPNSEVNDEFDYVENYSPGGMPDTVQTSYHRPIENQKDTWSPSDTAIPGYWNKQGRHRSEIQADTAIQMLETAAKKPEPFFMYIAFNAPHDPRQSPQEYIDKYPLDRVDLPPNFLPEYLWNKDIGAPRDQRGESLAPFPRTEYAVKTHRQEYYAIISHLDAQIARILGALEKSGVKENTYIIFAGDNGLAIGEHGLFAKQSLFEHSLGVPLFVIGPDIPKAKKIDAPVYLQDIMPTALEIGGANISDRIEFRSLLPLIRGERDRQYDALYGGYQDLSRTIRRDNYKLILYVKAQKVLLFDLKADPWEINDISDKEDNKPLIRSLFTDLLQLQKQYNDTLDLPKIFPELLDNR